MEQNNNSDELIEIKPDRIPEEEENDIKIYGSEFEDLTVPVSDTPAVTAPEPEIRKEDVSEEVTEDAPSPAEPVEAAEIAEPAAPEPVEEIDDFAEDLAEMENEEADMEMVEAIGDSIVQQVNSEIENSLIMMPDSIAQAQAQQVQLER